MKKILALVLAFGFLMLFSTSAFCENVDISSMTLDELSELREQIDAEMSLRIANLTDRSISGLLVGGKSIKPGTYMLTCVDDWIQLLLFESESVYLMGTSYAADIQTYQSGDNVVMHFDEGTTVVISGGSVVIEAASEDWVPKAE